MTPPPEAAPAEAAPERQLLRRFSVAERWIHRGTAALLGTTMITAAFLYLPIMGQLVGRRAVLVTVHEWAGLATPVPVLAGLFSRAFRADLGRLNRFTPHDRGWLRATLRRRAHPSGKFNPGQKVYAALAAGATVVMIGTGLVMWFTNLTPLLVRTGATFVHDWGALMLGALIIGHIWMASGDPESRQGLRTGYVPRSWARRRHPLWETEHHTDRAEAADSPRRE